MAAAPRRPSPEGGPLPPAGGRRAAATAPLVEELLQQGGGHAAAAAPPRLTWRRAAGAAASPRRAGAARGGRGEAGGEAGAGAAGAAPLPAAARHHLTAQRNPTAPNGTQRPRRQEPRGGDAEAPRPSGGSHWLRRARPQHVGSAPGASLKGARAACAPQRGPLTAA